MNPIVPLVAVFGLYALGSGELDFAPPASTPAQSVAVSSGATATYEQLADLAAGAGFPRPDQDDMVAIAMAESGGRLGVVSKPNSNGTRDRCAWQINDVHDYDRHRLVTDPAYCAWAAKDVYDRQGKRAWTVYKTGAYEQFLPEARAAVDS